MVIILCYNVVYHTTVMYNKLIILKCIYYTYLCTIHTNYLNGGMLINI